jgi:hypothetical protein
VVAMARMRYSPPMTWLLAIVLRPVAALVLFGLIALPLRMAFERWYPEGKVKRYLLRDLHAPRDTEGA